jgi:hypothetical protein
MNVYKLRQSFQVHIYTFVGILITSSKKEVQCLVQVEVKVAIEVTANKLCDLFFALEESINTSIRVMAGLGLGLRLG